MHCLPLVRFGQNWRAPMAILAFCFRSMVDMSDKKSFRMALTAVATLQSGAHLATVRPGKFWSRLDVI